MLSRLSQLLSKRCMSTTASQYPFSKVATFPQTHPESAPIDRLRKGKGLMEYLSKTLIAPEKREMVDVLFSRRHPQRLQPGSILTAHTQQPPYSFSGVLISVRRRGPDTSFTLRNVVQRMGVEMQFFVNSPDLKKIQVLRRAGGGGGKAGRRMRRAKLFYLRHSPDKMTAISSGVKA